MESVHCTNYEGNPQSEIHISFAGELFVGLIIFMTLTERDGTRLNKRYQCGKEKLGHHHEN